MDSQQTHSSYTQSTQSATTISTPTSYTESSNCENEPWGRLVVLKTSVRNLGVRKQPLFKVEEPSDCQKFGAYHWRWNSLWFWLVSFSIFYLLIDLAGPIFKVGRAPSNNLCCTSLNIEPKILEQFSGTHFKLSKEINDSHSPVFIEVRFSLALLEFSHLFCSFFSIRTFQRMERTSIPIQKYSDQSEYCYIMTWYMSAKCYGWHSNLLAFGI